MDTSYASFKIGIAAFIVPFMFFYNAAILMDGTWLEVIRAAVTSIIGVYLLSGAVQGWFVHGRASVVTRVALGLAAMSLIEGGLLSDLLGILFVAVAYAVHRLRDARLPAPDLSGRTRQEG